ncbi:hypothetical protein WFJ45_23310, partial [Salmonella enterica subsp. enterica serovar Minnesota]|uniref:hypothetical protein n=1 Tax=Salmonella enterica TaxID=28901 RepID=UPI003D2DE095
SAPIAALTADTDGDGADDAVGGDERLVAAGSDVELRVRVQNGTGYEVLVHASPGRAAGALATFRPVLPDETFTVPVTVPDGDSWYRVEV